MAQTVALWAPGHGKDHLGLIDADTHPEAFCLLPTGRQALMPQQRTIMCPWHVAHYLGLKSRCPSLCSGHEEVPWEPSPKTRRRVAGACETRG